MQHIHPFFSPIETPVFVRCHGADKKRGSMTNGNFEQQLLLKANRHLILNDF